MCYGADDREGLRDVLDRITASHEREAQAERKGASLVFFCEHGVSRSERCPRCFDEAQQLARQAEQPLGMEAAHRIADVEQGIERAMSDAAVGGTGGVRDGKRVDPSDVFKFDQKLPPEQLRDKELRETIDDYLALRMEGGRIRNPANMLHCIHGAPLTSPCERCEATQAQMDLAHAAVREHMFTCIHGLPRSAICPQCRDLGARSGRASGFAQSANNIPPGVGVKHDSDKPRMDLLDSYAIEQLARVLTFGAQKYEAHNWRKGLTKGRLIGAALRHLFAYLRGEDRDAETGLSHAAHAMCCCMFLVGLEHRADLDDRWKEPPKKG